MKKLSDERYFELKNVDGKLEIKLKERFTILVKDYFTFEEVLELDEKKDSCKKCHYNMQKAKLRPCIRCSVNDSLINNFIPKD